MKLREKLARLGGGVAQEREPESVYTRERSLAQDSMHAQAHDQDHAHEHAYEYDREVVNLGDEWDAVDDDPDAPSRERVRRRVAARDPVRPPSVPTAFPRTTQLSSLREQMSRVSSRLDRASTPAAPKPRSLLAQSWQREEPIFSSPTASSSAGLPGDTHDTLDGPLRVVRVDCAEDHAHGIVPVVSALTAASADLAVLALDPSLNEVDFARALYIDTETTGLAGGSGTLPFLIGMAWFEGERLCVEQLLLERPGLEVPMLRRLAERMACASAVVSFNGKSFDWPLLRTRFVLSRVAVPVLPPHLDLLHCARRVYKRRLGSVRLVHLEEELLGFTRVDDISGEMIPMLYLGFLRGQVHGSAIGPIVEHNRSDLIALAALQGELSRRFRGEAPAQDARDQLGFAGVAARAADRARALDFAAGAVEADVRGELACEAHFLAGELRLKALDIAAAEHAFRQSVEAACGDAIKAGRAHLALAKLYEHRLKRHTDALFHARHAAAWEGDEASARRVARLTLKCDRTTEPLLPRAFP